MGEQDGVDTADAFDDEESDDGGLGIMIGFAVDNPASSEASILLTPSQERLAVEPEPPGVAWPAFIDFDKYGEFLNTGPFLAAAMGDEAAIAAAADKVAEAVMVAETDTVADAASFVLVVC